MAAGLDKSSGVFYMGIVKDGVRCGDNKICVNQTCKDIPYDMVKYTKCPQNIPPHGGKMEECSTNGVSRMINFQFPVKIWRNIQINMQRVLRRLKSNYSKKSVIQ